MTIKVGNTSAIGGGGGASGMPVAPTSGAFAGNGSSWVNLLGVGSNTPFMWGTDITATDPGVNGIKANNADLSLITEIYISAQTLSAWDISDVLKLVTEEDHFTLNRFSDQTNFAIVRVTGDSVDNGTWFTIPVSVADSNGSILDGQPIALDYMPMAGRNPSVESLVFVRSLDDLPSQNMGIIDLLDDKQYIQVADIDFGTVQVRFGKARYSGLGTNVVTSSYSGTGALFLCTGESTLDNITLDTPNGSPLDWNTTGSVIMRWDNCTVTNCDRAATFTANGGAVRMGNVTYRNIVTNGHVLTGSFISFNYETAGIFITAGDIFDITAATFTILLNLRNLVVALFPTGTVFIRGLAGDANLAASCVASVTNSRLLGTGTPLVGVSVSDIRWDFTGVTPLPNSSKAGDTYLTAATTVPTTQNVWVPVAGVNWSSGVSERFTSTTAGVLTYIGRDQSNFLVMASSTVEKVGGGSDRIGTAISINGVITGAIFDKTVASTDNSSPTNITSLLLAQLSNGDTIQLYTTNVTSNADVIVDNSNMSLINGF